MNEKPLRSTNEFPLQEHITFMLNICIHQNVNFTLC